MVDTLINLALQPEYQIFVLISLTAYVAMFLLVERFAKSDFHRRAALLAATVLFILFCMVWSAHNDTRQLLIDKSMSFQRITGRMDLRLMDVRSLDGWGEGESAVGEGRERLVHGNRPADQGLPDAANTIGRVLDLMGLPQSGAQVVAMSPDEWVAFLRGLDSLQRRQIGRIPFAVVEIRSDDDKIDRVVMFRNDRHTVRDKAGRVVGRICLDRIFNVADAVSGEREAIMISHGRTCQ